VNLLWSLQRRLIFPRHLVRPDPRAGEGIAGLERLHVGETEGWLLPGDGVSADRPGPAVLFAHGNGELIDHWPAELEPYRRLGVSVLLAEYRGYGRSGGEPSEEGITEDYVAFYELLAARPEIDPARLVFHGRSLGGGVVCALAARRPPAALVLQSTFTSIADLARAFGVPRFLVRDPFDNLAVLPQLDRPVLIVHGTRDDVIPFSHAEALAKAARRPTRVSYDCRHNDCPPDPVRFWEDVRSFLEGQGVLR
jgi:fermentation-respiration switch protein FrsA (DUF1100 family)